jgi:hypothetical protein
MQPRARHPEVIALALIVLALAAGPVRPLPAADDPFCPLTELEVRLVERFCDIGTRLAERLAEIGERIGSRLEPPRLPIALFR